MDGTALLGILTLLVTTFGGAIAAVWKLLSGRIATLEGMVVTLNDKITVMAGEKAEIKAQRDVFAERNADLRQRLTSAELQRDEYRRLLDKALDMNATIHDLAKLKAKIEEIENATVSSLADSNAVKE